MKIKKEALKLWALVSVFAVSTFFVSCTPTDDEESSAGGTLTPEASSVKVEFTGNSNGVISQNGDYTLPKVGEAETFTIKNKGDIDLESINVTAGGDNAGDFNINLSSSDVKAAQEITFTITYNGTGYKTGQVSTEITVKYSAADDDKSFVFTVKSPAPGNGETSSDGPEITVKQGTNDILSGSAYNFSETDTAVSFTIENSGTSVLTLSSLAIDNSKDFTLTQPEVTAIEAGKSTSISITFNPATTDTITAKVTIENDDSDEGTFTFNVSGTKSDGGISFSADTKGYLKVNNASNKKLILYKETLQQENMIHGIPELAQDFQVDAPEGLYIVHAVLYEDYQAAGGGLSEIKIVYSTLAYVDSSNVSQLQVSTNMVGDGIIEFNNTTNSFVVIRKDSFYGANIATLKPSEIRTYYFPEGELKFFPVMLVEEKGVNGTSGIYEKRLSDQADMVQLTTNKLAFSIKGTATPLHTIGYLLVTNNTSKGVYVKNGNTVLASTLSYTILNSGSSQKYALEIGEFSVPFLSYSSLKVENISGSQIELPSFKAQRGMVYNIDVNDDSTTGSLISVSDAETNYSLTKPTQPIVTGDATSRTVTWSTVSGSTSYNVYRCTDNGADFRNCETIAESITDSSSTDTTSQTTGDTLYYRVASINNEGISERSIAAEITIP